MSLLHTNIYSLQGNFNKLGEHLHNLDHESDIDVLNDTWHDKNNVTYTPALLQGCRKYEEIPGSSKKGGCGVYVKNSIPYIVRAEFNRNHKITEVNLQHSGLKDLTIAVTISYWESLYLYTP